MNAAQFGYMMGSFAGVCAACAVWMIIARLSLKILSKRPGLWAYAICIILAWLLADISGSMTPEGFSLGAVLAAAVITFGCCKALAKIPTAIVPAA